MIRKFNTATLIEELTEVLQQGDGEFIEKIANMVLIPKVEYIGNDTYTQDTEDNPY